MKCTKCGKITGFVYGRNYIDGEPYCDDCYFEMLGDLVERHPIGMPFHNN